MITHETRRKAYENAPSELRRKVILKALEDDELTAREIMTRLGFADPNTVRPRITELIKLGEIEACGKKTDSVSGRTVAVFRKNKYSCKETP